VIRRATTTIAAGAEWLWDDCNRSCRVPLTVLALVVIFNWST
jgi:hypothetical protein